MHFALVVEFDLPADVQADSTLTALVDKIHAENLAPAENVTAHAGVSAELIGQAVRGQLILAMAERLHLEPGDHVVVTIKPEQADSDEDLQHWSDLAREAFPDHEIVIAWEGTTVTAQTSEA